MLSRPKVFLYLAVLLSACSFASRADAVGISYDFTMNSASNSWDLSAHGEDGSFYLQPSFFEFNPTDSFVAANPTVTGQFSYDTEAPIEYSNSSDDWDYSSYNSESFLIDFTSDVGETARFDVPDARSSLSVYTDPVRRYFHTTGWGGTDPQITLTGDGEGGGGCDEEFCGEGSFQAEMPIQQLRDKRPDLFNNIDHVEVMVYGYDPSATLHLDYVGFGMRGDTSLPTDGVLPESLPAVSEENYGWLSLDFSPQEQFLGMDLLFAGSSEDISPDQENQIRNFISGLYVDLDASVHYSLTDLTQLPIGTTPHNPIMPDDPDGEPGGGFDFTFDTPDDGEFTFIDPDVAVGYDYEVLTGPNFAAVLLPDDIGDGLYDIWTKDGAGVLVQIATDVAGGVAYDFGALGVDFFRVLGIETSEFLDPTDPLAFVTGLQFQIGGGTTIEISQTPITEFVVPEPTGLAIVALAMGSLFLPRKRSR